MSVVGLARCSAYEEEAVRRAVRRILEPFGGMARFVKAGDRVLIKPNLVAPGRPSSGICTHPLLVRAVCELVAESRPARIRVGDMPGYNFLGETDRCAEESGWNDALRGLNARFVHFEGTHVRTAGERFQTFHTIDLTREVLDADVVISLPKLKTHTQTDFTGAVKNLFGCVAYGTRERIHKLGDYRKFCRGLVDVFDCVRPALTIADLVRVQEGNGPCAGTPLDVGVLLAGADGVAVDAVGQFLLGFERDDVLTTVLAGERGLGESDLDRVSVAGPGDWRRWRVAARRPAAFYHFAYFRMPKPVFKAVAAAVRVKPVIDREACDLCRICLEKCPGRALSAAGDRIRRERKACRLCFGCVVVCPRRAVSSRLDRFSARAKSRSRKFLS